MRQGRAPQSERRRAQEIADRLHDVYGSPRHNNKREPVDELVFIIISQMTTGPSFNQVFDRLRVSCRTWKAVMLTPTRRLARVIKDADLSNTKPPRI
ncbi:hypothetical protein ACFL2T_00315 [Elusimicrobiota bacterium]